MGQGASLSEVYDNAAASQQAELAAEKAEQTQAEEQSGVIAL
jgi:hypothetical protein